MDYLFYEDKTRKNIKEIFKNNGFQIDIVTNLKEVNFLDATFNVTNGTFRDIVVSRPIQKKTIF